MIELFSKVHFHFTNSLLGDNKLTVFIDKSCEPVGFIKDLISFTDSLVDFKIKIVKKRKSAEIKFFEEIVIEDNPSYLGLAVPNNKSWNLYVSKYTGERKQWIYAHEFGHALGLEHPFDDRDGDYWMSTNSWESVTTEDTVMSYRYVPSNNWFYRQADIDTITGIWND